MPHFGWVWKKFWLIVKDRTSVFVIVFTFCRRRKKDIYGRKIGNASGAHLPSTGASSISACRTHLHSLPDSNHRAAATLQSGSLCQLIGLPFCCPADRIIKTMSVWNPPPELVSRPVLHFPCLDTVDTGKKNRRETQREDSSRYNDVCCSGGGLQTLLVLIILSAGQQKGHLSSWHRMPLCRGHSSWMVRVWGWMQVCAASWNRGRTCWWQVGFAGVSLINEGA